MAASPERFLFAYGTLMFPAIFRHVTGSDAAMQPATLGGFARRQVRGHTFPGLEPAPGNSVDGMLIAIEDPALWERLDRFESDFYVRIDVTAATSDGATVPAQTYVVTPGNRGCLESRDWNPQSFREHDMQRYLEDEA